MHSGRLFGAAGLLLLSSLVSLGLLVARSPRCRWSEAGRLLSVSDLSGAFVTAALLLVQGLGEGRLPQYILFVVPLALGSVSLLCLSSNLYSRAGRAERRCSALRGPRVAPRRSTTNYAAWGVGAQWLVAGLLAGSLRLGDPLQSRSVDDLLCTLVANLPLNDCFPGPETSLQEALTIRPIQSDDHLLGPSNDSSLSSVQTNELLSRIYGIIAATNNSWADEGSSVATLLDRFDFLRSMGTRANPMASRLLETHDMSLGSFPQLRSANYSSKKEQVVEHVLSLPTVKTNWSNSFFSDQFSNPQRLISQCVVQAHSWLTSTTFLKIHFFALLTLVYFVPILFSSLLLIVSRHKFRQALRKLRREKEALDNRVLRMGNDQETNSNNSFEKSSPGWFTPRENEEWLGQSHVLQGETFKTEKDDQPSGDISITTTQVETNVSEMLVEAGRMESLFWMFQVSALAAVAMWTPFFFQVLSKVFFCSNVPTWLTETTFFATVLYTIFRNAVNMNIVKIEADVEYPAVQNSIHPT